MGQGKKEANRAATSGRSSGDPKIKGENFYRTAKQAKKLKVEGTGTAFRNKEGKIVQNAAYQSRDAPRGVIEPNRKWFNNTRVISQETLTNFREAIAETQNDPYKVLLKSNKLPMSLIRDGPPTEDGIKKHKAKMTIETEPFELAFGKKSQRKRPKLSFNTVDDLAANTDKSLESYHAHLEAKRLLSGETSTEAVEGEGEASMLEKDTTLSTAKEAIFYKGTSKRIHNELYKVIDSSDVILHVLDARDPMGTRCFHVEKFIATEAPHKHLVFVLNKIDLVPASTVAAWIRVLSKEHPTVAIRASLQNPFGRGSLIDLLRQFSILHKDRKQISVGMVGYPNVGKSSVINTLRGKKVSVVAPIPGETKVWQYVTLMKRIYLIDCPGVVSAKANDSNEDLIFRSVVRIENVEHPEQYIPALLRRVKLHHIERTYQIKGWTTHVEFLELLARRAGRLLKGGEPDLDGVAKMVLNDFMRGKIPWFTPAPAKDDHDGTVREGREGRFGEILTKRKRDEDESIVDTTMTESTPAKKQAKRSADDEDAFEGFSSDSDSEVDEEDGGETAAHEDGDEDMIPLDDSSDEGDVGEAAHSDSDEGNKAEGKMSNIDIEGADEVAESEPEAAPTPKKKKATPAPKRQRKT
ncbi:NUC091 domain-containing protein [Podospora didyma]|uniref:Nucleolar GTP-binding protein 2 n=1 Tax=Podospora didyma TaxID=330526 RepID=A0AAE0P577_9PEZI|nr:NUC091 domain-containing protein [Podospora didyma]